LHAIKITGITTPVLTNVGYIYISYLKPGLHLIGFDQETNQPISVPIIKVKRSLVISKEHIGIARLRYWMLFTKDDITVNERSEQVKFHDITTTNLCFGFPKDFFEGKYNPEILKVSRFGFCKWNPEFKRARDPHSEICTASRPILKGFFKLTLEDLKRFVSSKKSMEFVSDINFLNFLELSARMVDCDALEIVLKDGAWRISKFRFLEDERKEVTTINSPIYSEPIKSLITVNNIIIIEKPIYCITAGIKRA